MNYTNAILLIAPHKVKAARVSYDDDNRNTQTIKKTVILDLKCGDLVIVQTNTRHNYTVAKVVQTDVPVDPNSDEKLSWIVQRVDLEPFTVIDNMEKLAIQKIIEGETKRKTEEIRSLIMEVAGDELKKLPIYTVDE